MSPKNYEHTQANYPVIIIDDINKKINQKTNTNAHQNMEQRDVVYQFI